MENKVEEPAKNMTKMEFFTAMAMLGLVIKNGSEDIPSIAADADTIAYATLKYLADEIED